MKHDIIVEGIGYRLRPVDVEDAGFVVQTRLEDAERNCYIHKISSDIKEQEKWIRSYFEREDDYYFIVENKLTSKSEGLIGIYDVKNNRAEWGRWVIQKGSMAVIESVDLICRVAFNYLNLDEIYSHTIEDNVSVVSFHNSAKEKLRKVIPNFFELNGKIYNAVEHYIDIDYYENTLKYLFQAKTQRIFERNLHELIGDFEFHHIGLACTDFDKEMKALQLLGYRQESPDFRDDNQGIIGKFIVANNQPRIELLKNTECSNTLNLWIKNKTKLYHFGYLVSDFDKALSNLQSIGAKIIRPALSSVYFKKRICFLMLSNMFMFELMEN